MASTVNNLDNRNICLYLGIFICQNFDFEELTKFLHTWLKINDCESNIQQHFASCPQCNMLDFWAEKIGFLCGSKPNFLQCFVSVYKLKDIFPQNFPSKTKICWEGAFQIPFFSYHVFAIQHKFWYCCLFVVVCSWFFNNVSVFSFVVFVFVCFFPQVQNVKKQISSMLQTGQISEDLNTGK